MKEYLARRFLYMVVLLFAVSAFSFFLIELPPGDYLTSYVSRFKRRVATKSMPPSSRGCASNMAWTSPPMCAISSG